MLCVLIDICGKTPILSTSVPLEYNAVKQRFNLVDKFGQISFVDFP